MVDEIEENDEAIGTKKLRFKMKRGAMEVGQQLNLLIVMLKLFFY